MALISTQYENRYVFTSDDSGVTWIPRTAAGARNWHEITMSADGTKMAAAPSYGYIYTSEDSGVTWTEQTNAGIHNWGALAASSDGTKIIAGDNGNNNGGYVYTSVDSGVTWAQHQDSTFVKLKNSTNCWPRIYLLEEPEDGCRILTEKHLIISL